MRKIFLALIGLLVLNAPHLLAQDVGQKNSASLISVKGHQFAFQRIGTFTYFLCSKKDNSSDCRKIADMDLQASVDWDELVKKAKKKSLDEPSGILVSETFVDQYGGPWTIQMRIAKASDKPQDFLKPFHASILAAFRGYKVSNSASGDIASAQVLLKQSEWDAAKKDLGLIPAKNKKFSFGDLFR